MISHGGLSSARLPFRHGRMCPTRPVLHLEDPVRLSSWVSYRLRSGSSAVTERHAIRLHKRHHDYGAHNPVMHRNYSIVTPVSQQQAECRGVEPRPLRTPVFEAGTGTNPGCTLQIVSGESGIRTRGPFRCLTPSKRVPSSTRPSLQLRRGWGSNPRPFMSLRCSKPVH